MPWQSCWVVAPRPPFDSARAARAWRPSAIRRATGPWPRWSSSGRRRVATRRVMRKGLAPCQIQGGPHLSLKEYLRIRRGRKVISYGWIQKYLSTVPIHGLNLIVLQASQVCRHTHGLHTHGVHRAGRVSDGLRLRREPHVHLPFGSIFSEHGRSALCVHGDQM